MYRRLTNNSVLMGAALGFVFFYFLFGLAPLNFGHVAWLIQQNNQDTVQHFIGWEFFRHEAWGSPPGAIKHYGAPSITSIVYTDSVPLLALALKCCKDVLPICFQYFGLWYASCYMLQGIFAYEISKTMVIDVKINSLVTFFFLLSPILLNRTIEHQALVAHWLLLAALLLYLKPYRPCFQWYGALLNLVALMVHAYLCLMVLCLWAALLARNVLVERCVALRMALYWGMVNFVLLMGCAWLTGYFVVSMTSDIQAPGFTAKSMNLLAPIWPGNWTPVVPGRWSRFLPIGHAVSLGQQYEGFNYLGMGTILLLVLAGAGTIKYKNQTKINLPHYLPLLVAAIILSAYSLSNQIACGEHIILNYSLPSPLLAVANSFRASGRFFWPVYYMLMIGTFKLIIKYHGAKKIILWSLFALIIQFCDISEKLNKAREHFHTISQARPKSVLDGNGWDDFAKYYHKVLFVPQVPLPKSTIENYQDYVYYAATNKMTINESYVAREDHAKAKHNADKLLLKTVYVPLDNDAIYIILSPSLYSFLQKKLTPDDGDIPIGNYHAIFPQAKKHRQP